jgi:hypothetical protein
LQEAACGERTTERMSIATWFVCRPVITEYNHDKTKTGYHPEFYKAVLVILSVMYCG